MSKLRQQIGDDQELTIQQIREQFAAAGIDPSVRKQVFEEISPLLQQVHDACAAAKVPFLMALDISDDESIAEGKSLCMSSMNLPGGIVSNLLRQACEIFRKKDDLELAFEGLSADNLFLECKQAGLIEHPDVPIEKWKEKVATNETDLGYWQFVSAVAVRSLNEQLSAQAMAAVQEALGGQLPTSGLAPEE